MRAPTCASRQLPGWLPSSSSRPSLNLAASLTCLLLLPVKMGGLKPSGAGTATTYAHVGHAAPCTSGSFASKNPMGPAARSLRIDSASAGNVGGAVTGLGPSVAVIGAGAAGLAAGRILREEGLRVTIFEKAQDMGGVWRYNPEPAAGAPMCECQHSSRLRTRICCRGRDEPCSSSIAGYS